MDNHRFDALTRSLASSRNRRQLLKGLLGLGAGLAATGSLRDADAARRPTPTPKPVSCPGQQTWDGAACVCPGGHTKCGPDCCPIGQAECCDNACCYGACYGEELCCSAPNIFCDGACQPWECCSDSDCPHGSQCDPKSHTCTCVPNCDGSQCGDDGCGGTCSCPEGEDCIDGICIPPCVPTNGPCVLTNPGVCCSLACLSLSGGNEGTCL